MDNLIATLIFTVRQLQITRYFDVAIFTVFVADFLHTLPTEINSIWAAPWSIVKVLYLISRYTPFFDGPGEIAIISLPLPSSEVCSHLLRAEIWSSGLGEACSLLLLVYRAYALVGRSRFFAILLSILALGMVAVTLSVASLTQGNILPTGNVPDIFPKCSVGEAGVVTNRLILAVPIVTIIYETILFGVVYWAKIKTYKQDDNWLMRKIYRDAFMYYLFLLVVAVASLILWFTTSGSVREMSSSLPRYISSIISSRIILNIRQYAGVTHRTTAETGLTGVGGETTQAVSGLRFANISGQVSVVDA